MTDFEKPKSRLKQPSLGLSGERIGLIIVASAAGLSVKLVITHHTEEWAWDDKMAFSVG